MEDQPDLEEELDALYFESLTDKEVEELLLEAEPEHIEDISHLDYQIQGWDYSKSMKLYKKQIDKIIANRNSNTKIEKK